MVKMNGLIFSGTTTTPTAMRYITVSYEEKITIFITCRNVQELPLAQCSAVIEDYIDLYTIFNFYCDYTVIGYWLFSLF